MTDYVTIADDPEWRGLAEDAGCSMKDLNAMVNKLLSKSGNVVIPLETLRHLYDLAMDSPLICSGNFDSDDVVVLRETAARIGVDPVHATPDEFIRDYPHPFRPTNIQGERDSVKVDRFNPPRYRLETDDEVIARLGPLSDRCQAGTYDRRCGRPAADEKHTQVTT